MKLKKTPKQHLPTHTYSQYQNDSKIKRSSEPFQHFYMCMMHIKYSKKDKKACKRKIKCYTTSLRV